MKAVHCNQVTAEERVQNVAVTCESRQLIKAVYDQSPWGVTHLTSQRGRHLGGGGGGQGVSQCHQYVLHIES